MLWPYCLHRKVISRYLKIKTRFFVHSLASNSNTNTMILKLKKFKCQFTPIKWYVSNDLFQKAITKSFCNCVFIVLYAYLSCSLLSSNYQPQVDPYFFISVIAPVVRTVLENCEVLIEKNWYWNTKRDIYHLLSSCHCIPTLYLFWFRYLDLNQRATLVTFNFEFWFRTFNLEITLH